MIYPLGWLLWNPIEEKLRQICKKNLIAKLLVYSTSLVLIVLGVYFAISFIIHPMISDFAELILGLFLIYVGIPFLYISLGR